MKSFSERNTAVMGIVGSAVLVAVFLASLNYDKLPFLAGTRTYSAFFSESGGIAPDSPVRVNGVGVGKVSSVHLEGPKVRVDFTARNDVRLGDLTEAAIKVETILGTKMIEVLPRGVGKLAGPIPLERTRSPYDLPSALGDLSATISGLDLTQLSSALTTVAQTFEKTPPDLKHALEGIGRLSDAIGSRDRQLRDLLSNANKVSAVLAERSDQIVRLVKDSNALLAELLQQRDAVDRLHTSLTQISQQISGLVNDNRSQMRPALDKLNSVLEILDNRRQELQTSLPKLTRYITSLGESVSAGPFFKVYISNLLPGQLTQPFIDAAFSDLGLDPNVLLPSQLSDPPDGQPGTPALPLPYPRTGQGGDPNVYLPDAITGNPGDPRYPYREPLPAPPPGGPPPGPPAAAAPGLASTPEPTPAPVYIPAPREVASTPAPNATPGAAP